jgi:hypothetical protein
MDPNPSLPKTAPIDALRNPPPVIPAVSPTTARSRRLDPVTVEKLKKSLHDARRDEEAEPELWEYGSQE